ncbi:hypothetical protein PVAP13_5NG058008 [Panicum virgatum]|uniref:Uncharacterized protein n=2 Tax=Panicum virgatum TaxID=38727 RepID=A0A8T0RKJ0_PANVG|nr:hypothetical protein PVAP13_5NG058008 [Panicum virgatum]
MAASSSPSKSNNDVMDFVAPQLMKPIPLSTVLFVSKFDISSMGKVLTARDGRSIVEKMEAIKKNLESFKWPSATRALPDEDYEDVEDEDDGEDDNKDDDDELMGDENKPASDVELQAPNEGEQECKKPRLSGSFLVRLSKKRGSF